MASHQMVMFQEEAAQMKSVCERLVRDANAKAVLCMDKNGQPFAQAGDTAHIDVTSLSSLTAGNVAATGGIASLLSEKEFSGQFHEGEKTNIHISIVAQRLILVVLFDDRASLGLVRLRVRRTSEELARVMESMVTRATASEPQSVFAEITDEDIDNMFKD